MAKSALKKLEEKLWDLCRKIIFKIYGRTCYTCGQTNLEGRNLQCGHYFPKGALGAKMKYDIRILRPQCFNCNINYGGMGGVFRERMAEEIGRDEEKKLFLECQSSKSRTVKSSEYYPILIADYEKKLSTIDIDI